MVTHQDLLLQYKSENGSYPTSWEFGEWVEDKYLKTLNTPIENPISTNVTLDEDESDIFSEPTTVERFWGLEYIEDERRG